MAPSLVLDLPALQVRWHKNKPLQPVEKVGPVSFPPIWRGKTSWQWRIRIFWVQLDKMNLKSTKVTTVISPPSDTDHVSSFSFPMIHTYPRQLAVTSETFRKCPKWKRWRILLKNLDTCFVKFYAEKIPGL